MIIRSKFKICALSIRSWPPRAATTCACNLGQPLVTCIGDDIEQLLHTLAPDRRDDPKLGKMGTDRIDHRGLLTDEQMARAMKHQAALLLRGLGLDEPHVGSRDSLADRLCVGRIVLLSLDIRLHIGRRHQAHRMAKRLEFARPMVRRCASLDANQARWQLMEERQDVARFN